MFRYRILAVSYFILLLFLAVHEVGDQDVSGSKRFVVINHVNNEFVYSARYFYDRASAYICQLQRQGLFEVEPYWVTAKYHTFKYCNLY